jgi:hypothetical protein
VLGRSERTLVDGKRVCEVRFVYVGREAEEEFWEEPCADVDARMVSRGDLETLGRWERLDSFQQKFVGAMPAGTVLYIGGKFSASVYPIDETGTSIEVAVAD